MKLIKLTLTTDVSVIINPFHIIYARDNSDKRGAFIEMSNNHTYNVLETIEQIQKIIAEAVLLY